MIAIAKFADPIIMFFFLSFLLALYLCPLLSNCETDTLLPGQELKDGYHLDSVFGVFRLGFFTAQDKNRYLGIWYNVPDDQQQYRRQSYLPPYFVKSEPSPVWVGNKNSPIPGKTGALVIAVDGNLKIVNGSGDPIAVVNPPVQGVSGKTSAILRDSGNFILRELNPDGSVKRELWQSFDYPTDTLLPWMKLGANFRTGHVWSLKPWLGPTNFALRLDHNGTTKNQLVILFKGRVYWRSGQWPGQTFPGFNFSNVSDNEGEERYVVYSVKRGGGGGDDDVAYPRITITRYGTLTGQRTKLVGCDLESPGYKCFRDGETPACGIVPYANSETTAAQDYEELPPGRHVRAGQCRLNCSQSCTCLAYPRQSRDGSGCQMGIKLGYSLSYPTGPPRSIRSRWQLWLIIAGVVPLALCLILFLLYLGWKWRSQLGAIVTLLTRSVCRLWERCRSFLVMWKEYYVLLRLTKAIADAEQEILLQELGMEGEANINLVSQGNDNNDFQLFSFEQIASATSNFHTDNKLGQGGFGPVYKGKLASGIEVAIKRLSRSSRQGLVEFKNEVRLIAKLQHDNLVRLVGCCIENREKILVYEYLPTKSLDFSLFAPAHHNVLLDWKKRFDIIQGIAQGLVYLHKYSRLKIVHRDLKASNILLDSEMNPKISDFGLAKIFHPNESRAITARVAGTFGYMSPEYAMEGVFSTKSDVFSFGVLLLEIVSGKRNNHFRGDHEGTSSLLAWAWELWREGRGAELVDPSLGIDSSNNNNMRQNEAVKCSQIGLLCVQESPRDRPSMLKVSSMIYNNDSVQLSSPNRPAFYYRMSSLQEVTQIIEEQEEIWTANQVTITEMNAR